MDKYALHKFDTCSHCESIQPSTGDDRWACRWCGIVNKPKGDRGIYLVMLLMALLLLVGGLMDAAMGGLPMGVPVQINAPR